MISKPNPKSEALPRHSENANPKKHQGLKARAQDDRERVRAGASVIWISCSGLTCHWPKAPNAGGLGAEPQGRQQDARGGRMSNVIAGGGCAGEWPGCSACPLDPPGCPRYNHACQLERMAQQKCRSRQWTTGQSLAGAEWRNTISIVQAAGTMTDSPFRGKSQTDWVLRYLSSATSPRRCCMPTPPVVGTRFSPDSGYER